MQGHYIKYYVLDGSLQGINLHGMQPSSSHNHFVDGTMLMNYPTAHEANELKTIINDFSEAFGTSFNLDKSQLFFFNNPPKIQLHISLLLSILGSSLQYHYLGLPHLDLNTHNISQDSLILEVSNPLSNWTFRSLNLPARLFLMNSMLQAIIPYMFYSLEAP